MLYPNGPPKFKRCLNCERELYCSSKCREMAWEQYHKLLCTGFNKSNVHPFLELENLAKYFIII